MKSSLSIFLIIVGSSQGFFFSSLKSSIPSKQHTKTESATELHSTKTVDDYGNNVMNTYGRYPMTISHGKGSHLYDTDGNEYLDMCAGIATCCLGHSHPALKKAVSDQMDRVHHCSNLYFIPEQAALAKWLVKNSCADKVC